MSVTPDADLTARLLDVATRHGNEPAIVGPCAIWTYAELIRRTAAVAGRLCASGAGRGSRVGLFVDHDEHAVAAVLGAVMAGAAYVPLDRRWPRQRQIAVARDAELTALVTADLESAVRLDLGGLPLIGLVDVEHGPECPKVIGGEASDVAYLLYTSGSMGEPKGVVQSRGNVAAHADAYRASLRMTRADRTTLLARISFDAAVMDLFGSLLSGACLCIADPTAGFEPGVWLQRNGVTILHATPTVLRHIIRRTTPAQRRSLRCVVSGGEALLASDAEVLRGLAPEVVVVNGYGPTECTTALQYQIGAAGLDPESAVPLGRPLSGVRIEIVGPTGDATPPGEAGELVLYSPYLAMGYWRRPELTASAFMVRDGRPAYRTGDVVSRRPDGALMFVGRRDSQVKIRGCRIELGEVESRLLAYPGVSAAAVVAVPGTRTATVLAAFVSGIDPSELERLREALAARLIPEAVPATLEILDPLPLTDSGKIDRATLAARAAAGTEGDGDGAADVLLASIARALGVPRVRSGDNFLRLGGDSLNAMECAIALSGTLGVTVPPVWFLDTVSFAELSARIATLADRPARAASERETVFPLPSPHRRYWARIQAGEPAAAFHLLLRSEITGRLDIDALQRALHTVARRHAWLRTGFEVREGAPVCVVHDEPRLVAVAHEPGMGRRNELATLEPVRPFALASPPLARISLTRVGPNRHVMDCLWHHLIMDGWSRRQFERELFGLCAGIDVDEPAASSRASRLDDEDANLAWWARRLCDLRILEPRALLGEAPVEVAAASLRVPAEWSSQVRAAAANAGCSLFTYLLSAVAVVVADATGRERIAVTTDIARRPASAREIGLFTDILLLPLDLRGERDGPALLREVRSTVVGAMRHPVSFERLMREILHFDLARYDRAFPIAFFLEREDPPQRYGDLVVATRELPLQAPSRDLILTAVQSEGDALSFHATARRAGVAALERVLERIVSALGRAVDASTPSRTAAPGR